MSVDPAAAGALLAHGGPLAGAGAGGPRWWETDPASLIGTALIAGAAGAYLVAARRPSQHGRRWPWPRVIPCLTGLTLLAVTLFSGVAAADEHLPVHVGQHLALMMVVAPLLVAGGPLRLLLRTLPRQSRMEVASLLQDPAVRALTAGRWTAGLLVADYYGSMAVYLLTPLYRWSTEHVWLHVAAHVYFLLCGVLFWLPLLGEDPTGWRPSSRTRLVMTAVGAPLSALSGWVLIARSSGIAPNDLAETTSAGWVLLLAGGALSVAAAAVIALRAARARPQRHVLGVPWPAAS